MIEFRGEKHLSQKKDPFFAACSYHCEKNANMLTAKIKIANLKTNFAWFVMTKKRIDKKKRFWE